MKALARTLDRIGAYVLGTSALLALAAFLVAGLHVGAGALAGGVFAAVNWQVMRWVGGHLIKASDRGRLVWGSILMAKMAVVLLAAWGVLATGWVDPAGFAVGLGGLVLGVLAGAFHAAATGELDTLGGEDDPAGEDGEGS